jgi:DNA-directed RNA polymerase subunit M/transcription elongation factor TFIIS
MSDYPLVFHLDAVPEGCSDCPGAIVPKPAADGYELRCSECGKRFGAAHSEEDVTRRLRELVSNEARYDPARESDQ